MTRRYPFTEPRAVELDPCLADVREREPVCRIRPPYGGEAWLVTRYEDVRAVLSDPRFSRAAATGPDVPRMTPEPGGAASILMADPPDHTRLRGLLARAFTTRQVAQLRPRVASLVEDLLSTMDRHGPPADLVAHLAAPLPILIICELLGVPPEDRHRFQGWVAPLMSSTAYPGEQVREAVDQFSDYVCDLIDERRVHPTEDLIGALVRARDDEDRLSELELVTFVGVLLVAGFENTSNQIANFTWQLLTRPDLAASLRSRAGAIDAAIEELLRYLAIGTGVSFARIATEDVELSGTRIAKGEAVLVSLPAANRDPRVFADPETIDLARAPNPHLVFGPGIHHCMGAALTRMELQEAIGALLRRFPGLRLAVPAEELEWKSGLLVRGPVALPVAW